MKVKLSLDKNTIQTFFLDNVEKIVLGGVVICFLLMVYSSFGRDRFKQSPKDLLDSANNAERHWKEETKVDDNDDFKKCVVTDYQIIASKGQQKVREEPYAHKVLWNKPLFPKLPLRPEPPRLAVEELIASSGRGPFMKGSGAAAPAAGGAGADRAGAPVKGYRWVGLVGAIPLKKQSDAFKKAFDGCRVANPQGNTPYYRLFYVQRAEVTGRGADNLKWVDIDLEEVRKTLQGLAKGQADPLDAKFQDNHVMDREATFELPMPGSGRAPMTLSHPRIVGPLYGDVRPDPAAFAGKKVSWLGEPLATENHRVIYARVRRERGVFSDSDVYAVDYASAEAAKVAPKGVVTAIIQGKTDVSVPMGGDRRRPIPGVPLLRDAAAPTDRSVAPPVRDPNRDPLAPSEPKPEQRQPTTTPKPTATDRPADELPDHQLFRFVDFTAQPGKKYRYRVQTLLKNPNYGLEPNALEKPELGEKPWLRSAWSEPSNIIEVPLDTRLVADAVTPGSRAKEVNAAIKVKKWVESNGIEAGEKFSPCFRGCVLDFPNRMFPPGGAGKPGKPDKGKHDLPGVEIQPARVNQFKVDYITGAVLVDMRGERISAREASLNSPGEVLVLESDGALRVYSELEAPPDDDADNAEPEADRPPETTPKAGGPSGLEGGLNF